MCYSNSSTMLCKTPLSDYAKLPQKAGLRLCLNVKATMLLWCATENITPEDLSIWSKMQFTRGQCKLSFGDAFDAKVGKRLDKQIKRFARIAHERPAIARTWRTVADAAEFLRGAGHKDWWDEADGGDGLAGAISNLSLEHNEVMREVRRLNVPSTMPSRPGGGSSKGSNVSASRITLQRPNNAQQNTEASRRSQNPIDLNVGSVITTPWKPNSAISSRSHTRVPSTASDRGRSVLTTQTSTSPRADLRKGSRAVKAPIAVKEHTFPADAENSISDEAASQLWQTLYKSSGGDWDGMDNEHVHFEKCLRMQDLGIKLAIEADLQMKTMALRGVGR